jgi:enoyl-CoA hydratase/carnithine racemase
VSADPVEEAKALARTIAAQSPHAIRAGKALCDRAPHMRVADALAYETELQMGLLGTPNQMEAVQAAMTKRARALLGLSSTDDGPTARSAACVEHVCE